MATTKNKFREKTVDDMVVQDSSIDKNDIEEIKQEYLNGLTFHFVHHMHEVLEIALTKENVKNPIEVK